MNLIHLYFNPSGRINRSTFWLEGVLLLRLIWFVIYVLEFFLVVTLIFNDYMILRLDRINNLHELFIRLGTGSVGVHSLAGFVKTLIVDSASVFRDLGVGQVVAATFVGLILWPIDTWTTYAVTAKRLHDTNRPAWWALVWAGVYLVGTLTVAFIVGWFVWLALSIWMLVWLGFKEGSPDRNRYGEPQPTTGVAAALVNLVSHQGPATPPSPRWMFLLPAALSVIFAGLVIVGAFPTWITDTVFRKGYGDSSGIDGGTGIFTLIMGAVAGVGVLFGLSRQHSRQTVVIGAVVCFLLGITITIVTLLLMTGLPQGPRFEIGPGLKMTLIGGIGLAVANSGWLLSRLFVPIGTRKFEYGGGQPSGYGLPQTRYGPQEHPLPRQPGNAMQDRMKTCPYCAESIRYTAIKCRYCGSDISAPEAGAPRIAGRMKTCPYCAESIPYDELRCPYCDSDIPEEADSSQP